VTGPAPMGGAHDELRDLELRRCAAISSGDVDALTKLLSDDYVHVHMTGRVDDRAGHVGAVSSRPRRTTRGDLTIRTWDDLAVITGELTNHMTTPEGEAREVHACCHQVAVRTDGSWRFVSIQLTPLRV
jgi:ketosteroid isomerase-like protein